MRSRLRAVRPRDGPGVQRARHRHRRPPQGALAIYGGHLFISPFQVADPGDGTLDAFPDLADASRRVILGELARHQGVLLSTLFGGCGGGVVHEDGGAWRLA